MVLVTEPARDGGKIVTGRKGVARFEVSVKGVPAHAGTRPEDGRSAIRELANVIQTLEALNDPARGITVNVGVVNGGTRPDVIAEHAYAEVDPRLPNLGDADEIVAKILTLKSRATASPSRSAASRTDHPTKRATPALRCSSMQGRWRPTSASISSTPSPAVDRTATSPRRSPRPLTVSASTARARIPTTSRCMCPRSSRGPGCCIGCFRRCDERCGRHHGDTATDADGTERPPGLILRPAQGPQLPRRPPGRPDRTSAAATRARHRNPRRVRTSAFVRSAHQELRLEIGFGGGEHLVAEAASFPTPASSAASPTSTAWRRSSPRSMLTRLATSACLPATPPNWSRGCRRRHWRGSI